MKTLTETKEAYLKKAIFFAPEYEQQNEILENFKSKNSKLNQIQTDELIDILRNSKIWNEKFFVADLLYFYDNLDYHFLEPLIKNAITYNDPSFNRIFLNLALKNFGLETVVKKITEQSITLTESEKENIEKLNYWINIYKSENI